MLHTLLSITRPLFVLDTETSGVNENEDRIIEFGFQMWTPEGMVKEWRSLVNPGIHIPEEATAIHGITDAMVQGCRVCGRAKDDHQLPGGIDDWMDDGGPDVEECEYRPWPYFKQIAPNIATGFKNCDFAGKHVRYDIGITAAEMARAGVAWTWVGARIVDIDRLEHIAVPRNLKAMHKKYTGEEHEGAHGVLSDIRASVTVMVKQFETHEILPRSLDTLHTLQFPGMIDLEGKFKFVDGVPCFGQWGKHQGKPMVSVPIDYYDFILRQDFSEEVKAIARAVKLGKYPSLPGTPQVLVCMNGHSQYSAGCVSCILLHKRTEG